MICKTIENFMHYVKKAIFFKFCSKKYIAVLDGPGERRSGSSSGSSPPKISFSFLSQGIPQQRERHVFFLLACVSSFGVFHVFLVDPVGLSKGVHVMHFPGISPWALVPKAFGPPPVSMQTWPP